MNGFDPYFCASNELEMETITEKIAEKYQMLENLELWLLNHGINETFAQLFKVGISLAVMIILALIADFITQKIFLVSMARMAKRTKTEWDDLLIKHKFFHKLSHLAPALVVYLTIGIALYDYSPKLTLFIQALTKIYMIFIVLLVFNAFLNAVHEIYQGLPFAKNRPIKGYLQVVKILIYFFGGIVIVSIIINKNPASLLVGLGASAAVLMLVFKDTILGLVASIQLSANNLLKPGDWIEMPGRNIDGEVIEITLNTVKVQNSDRTINTIPTYALVTESFQNWRGMEESNGRRIRRSVLIDMKSIKFCTPEMIERYKMIPILKDIDKLLIRSQNDNYRPTNFGVFRKYIEFYLKQHPLINQQTTILVRHRQPTEHGIPMEVYCYSSEKNLYAYEEIQSDIFDHIIAFAHEFDIRIFQIPGGDDLKFISQGKA